MRKPGSVSARREGAAGARGPLVSIVTASFEPGILLENTLKSCLGQTWTDWEIVVVDGGSHDAETLDVLRRCRDRISVLIQEPDKGIYDAMNKGIRAAKGDFVVFLNCGDELASPAILAELATWAERGYDLVYGDALLLSETGEQLQLLRAKSFTRLTLAVWGTRTVCHQCVFVRRQLARPYSMRYRLKSELNWYFDLLDSVPASRVRRVHSPFVRYLVGGRTHRYFALNTRERLDVLVRRAGILGLLIGVPMSFLSLALNLRFRRAPSPA